MIHKIPPRPTIVRKIGLHPLPGRVKIARLYRALRPLMSGVGSRETGLDSLFASKPVGPGFEPCLGQSAKLAGAPKPLCLSVCRQERNRCCRWLQVVHPLL